MPAPRPPTRPQSRTVRKGARRLSNLLDGDIRRLSNTRGFAETKLLTHWTDIVGGELAALCRPVKVAVPRGAQLGATLTVLTDGARAPMLQMSLPKLIDRVNAVYGYTAIARVQITQTAPEGFGPGHAPAFGLAEAQSAFDGPDRRPAPVPDAAPDPQQAARARRVAEGVGDDGLRASLERLAANIISRRPPTGGRT